MDRLTETANIYGTVNCNFCRINYSNNSPVKNLCIVIPKWSLVKSTKHTGYPYHIAGLTRTRNTIVMSIVLLDKIYPEDYSMIALSSDQHEQL